MEGPPVTPRTDYFTRREFRDYVGDRGNRWHDSRIDMAQAEVIERLEAWAHSAWPNVAVVAGIGTMALNDDGLVLTDGAFDPLNDEGRSLSIAGAGPDGGPLVTTISVLSNANTATLADPAVAAVTGATVTWGDGDGTAAAPRVRTDSLDGGTDLWVLRGIPVIELSAASWHGEVLLAEAYNLYPLRGHITFWTELGPGSRSGEVTYTYGFTECPVSVKRPCMQATKSLMQSFGEGGSKLPPNVTEYTTENTTFVLDQSKSPDIEPWPWDASANRDINTYWGPHRPAVWLAV
jgi:hypothetical protein